MEDEPLAEPLNATTHASKSVQDSEIKSEDKQVYQKKALNKIMKYQRAEMCSLVVGMVWLLLGSVSDLVVPLYIGFVIDALNREDYNVIGKLCLELLLIVLVSYLVLTVCRALAFVSALGLTLSTR